MTASLRRQSFLPELNNQTVGFFYLSKLFARDRMQRPVTISRKDLQMILADVVRDCERLKKPVAVFVTLHDERITELKAASVWHKLARCSLLGNHCHNARFAAVSPLAANVRPAVSSGNNKRLGRNRRLL